MVKKLTLTLLLGAALIMTGCASVPMAPADQDAQLKEFSAPAEGYSGVYVYRDSLLGQALKKGLTLDGHFLGKTANKVYFYKEMEPGKHVLTTQSEFGENQLEFTTEAGKNYFFEQYIKPGVFVGGSNVKAVSESKGMAKVKSCRLAETK